MNSFERKGTQLFSTSAANKWWKKDNKLKKTTNASAVSRNSSSYDASIGNGMPIDTTFPTTSLSDDNGIIIAETSNVPFFELRGALSLFLLTPKSKMNSARLLKRPFFSRNLLVAVKSSQHALADDAFGKCWRLLLSRSLCSVNEWCEESVLLYSSFFM